MKSNIYIGYHGCEKEIGLAILNGQSDLLPSHNSYDWLGDGMYFWENDARRALDFATFQDISIDFETVSTRLFFLDLKA